LKTPPGWECPKCGKAAGSIQRIPQLRKRSVGDSVRIVTVNYYYAAHREGPYSAKDRYRGRVRFCYLGKKIPDTKNRN